VESGKWKVEGFGCVLKQKNANFGCVLKQKIADFGCVLKQIVEKYLRNSKIFSTFACVSGEY
jgi:hypothetical protein